MVVTGGGKNPCLADVDGDGAFACIDGLGLGREGSKQDR